MNNLFKPENIKLNATLANQNEAIEAAGNLLVEQGYVTASYVEKMKEREALTSTYMGNFVAIPHGTDEAKTEVKASGLSMIQVPDGVSFNGEEVKLVIGIAGKDGEHLELLSKIAILCSEIENVEKLVAATSKEEIIRLFDEVEV